jgi:hypothetical protein
MRQLQAGDTLVVIQPFKTLGTQGDGLEGYVPGDQLTLVERTEENPFQHSSDQRWKVKCKHYEPPQPEAVWCYIPTFVAKGMLARAEPIPDYGDLMSLQEWREAVACGGFIDYDGHGIYSNGTVMFRDKLAIPSEARIVEPPEGTTHVVWFNK